MAINSVTCSLVPGIEVVIGVGTGGAPGACAPMLLYKFLTTLCVVSDCAPPPNQKVFPTPLVVHMLED